MTLEFLKLITFITNCCQNCRMQVFVPAAMAERMARLIGVGKIYIIKNFQVKDYTTQDKFRPVHIDRQISFMADTKIKEIHENDIFIPKNFFDFYPFEDLTNMAKQTQNLIGMSLILYTWSITMRSPINNLFNFTLDVVGVIHKTADLKIVDTKNGKTHIKFALTDGR